MDGTSIYMDHGATTSVETEVVKAMQPWYSKWYGNPSGIYEFADNSKKAVEHAREVIAESIGVKPEEIYFTGGGTEADNWILKGMVFRDGLANSKKHIITSAIEHHAVLHSCQFLERMGCEVTYLPVDEAGMIDVRELEQAIRPETVLISIMFANNEIGTIQPVREIGQIAQKYHIPFHTDAVQAYLHVPIQAKELGITALSASSHKFNGPKGVGFLYLKEGTELEALLHGGAQEKRMRAGTENVPGIVGMGRAVELGMQYMEQDMAYVKELRDYMLYELFREIPDLCLNGSSTKRLPGNINISLQYVEGASLLVLLDMEGICASAGSACTAGDRGISHVLQAIGLPEDLARGTIRFTLGPDNTKEEVDQVVRHMKQFVQDLRGFSEESDS